VQHISYMLHTGKLQELEPFGIYFPYDQEIHWSYGTISSGIYVAHLASDVTFPVSIQKMIMGVTPKNNSFMCAFHARVPPGLISRFSVTP